MWYVLCTYFVRTFDRPVPVKTLGFIKTTKPKDGFLLFFIDLAFWIPLGRDSARSMGKGLLDGTANDNYCHLLFLKKLKRLLSGETSRDHMSSLGLQVSVCA
jgi:hypothetical protein